MAPEQHLGEHEDARSDQFAFCVSLWEALFGSRPFAAGSIEQIAAAKANGAVVPPPLGSPVPRRVLAVLLRGLQARPEQRFPDMDALLSALFAGCSRRRWPAYAAAALVAALAVVGVASTRGGSCDDDAIAAVWNARRGGDVLAAMQASAPAYADASWAAVERGVSSWVERWREARTDSCARQSAGEDAALAATELTCLDDRLGELDALLEVLETGDPAAVERAPEVVARLGEVESCLGSVVRRLPLPPPAIAAEVEDVRAHIRHARALGDAGNPRAAADAADEAFARASAIDHAPLLVEALALRGTARQHVG
ncbi:MAG: hypothetical protein L0210_05210, partial [Rhodospirillales bacterium]|nr:hypothetical protein [Rhodospirillales bacterium]